jgi:hypothetical protein
MKPLSHAVPELAHRVAPITTVERTKVPGEGKEGARAAPLRRWVDVAASGSPGKTSSASPLAPVLAQRIVGGEGERRRTIAPEAGVAAYRKVLDTSRPAPRALASASIIGSDTALDQDSAPVTISLDIVV